MVWRVTCKIVFLSFRYLVLDFRINVFEYSYSRVNRLNCSQSSHQNNMLAPRCRLILVIFVLRDPISMCSILVVVYVSWVQNDVSQFGLYLWIRLTSLLSSTRGLFGLVFFSFLFGGFSYQFQYYYSRMCYSFKGYYIQIPLPNIPPPQLR